MVNTNILVLEFYYGYIENIEEISVNILIKILMKQIFFQNSWESSKKLKKNDKINKNIMLKLFCKCNWYKCD